MKHSSLMRWPVAVAGLALLWAGAAPRASAGAEKDKPAGVVEDAELVETRREVPKLKAPAPYEPKDNTVEIELSQYAGYAGLVAANGGLEPSENSFFFKKHHFKVKLSLSEEESWGRLNSGQMAASATTADVLAVYGNQFQVVVPAQIGYSRGADAVVTDARYKSINDLKGKTLSSCQFTESDFFIRYLAQNAGLEVNMLDDLKSRRDPDKLNLVFCADGFGAGDLFLRDFKAGRGRLDGCVTWSPKTGEVLDGAGGKANLLSSNANILIVADILIVNRGFARSHPEMVAGLVHGLIEGNRMMTREPAAHLDVVAKAMKWDHDEAEKQLKKVHLANLPENLGFFDGTIDSAGSYGYIFESTLSAYGPPFVKAPRPNPDNFLDLKALKELDKSGEYGDEKPNIVPIPSTNPVPDVEARPLALRGVRFQFPPNSHHLDLQIPSNAESLKDFAQQLNVAPGSRIKLIGHAEDTLVEKFRHDGGEALVREVGLKAMQLSKDRAAEVARILETQYHVDPSKISVEGHGWNDPVGKLGDQNRVVELQWFTLQ